VIGSSPVNFGGVVADEPRAALVARDVLAQGGSAADAAAALYFALSVTYPSAASLGGGGVCLIHNRRTKKVEALDFTVGDGTTIGVPGAVRGMFALHARYGRLRWERIVQPAENLARFGFPISRALARHLGDGNQRAARRARDGVLLAGSAGKATREGDDLRQIELAAVLGNIRRGGAGAFYNGLLAKQIVSGTVALGIGLTRRALRSYRPVWREPVTESAGDHTAYFASTSAKGGAIAARLWTASGDGGVPVDASLNAYGALARPASGGASDRPPDLAVSSFGVIDRAGGAVACAVTMNGLFGADRMISGTGIIAARPPRPGADGGVSLAPMLIANPHTGDAFFVAGGSGNAAAPTSLISVSRKVVLGGRGLRDALAEPRVHAGSVKGVVFVETGVDPGVIERFKGRGLRQVSVPSLAEVNAIHCPKGIVGDPKGCAYAVDGRGHGFAAVAIR